MIFIRTIHEDTDTVEMVEAETPAGELSLAIGVAARIEREKPGAEVSLYRGERLKYGK